MEVCFCGERIGVWVLIQMGLLSYGLSPREKRSPVRRESPDVGLRPTSRIPQRLSRGPERGEEVTPWAMGVRSPIASSPHRDSPKLEIERERERELGRKGARDAGWWCGSGCG